MSAIDILEIMGWVYFDIATKAHYINKSEEAEGSE